MSRPRLVLLLINTMGGAAVIGSYVLGLRGETGADVLWGGVPAGIRPVYTVSMVLSALGYFAFLNLLLLRVDPKEVTVGGRFGYGIFYPIFLLTLIPSALWMPLTNLYVSDPSAGTWAAVRIVLFIVGLASIALAWALFALRPGNTGKAYWAAVVGACYFAFHTFVPGRHHLGATVQGLRPALDPAVCEANPCDNKSALLSAATRRVCECLVG